MKSAYFVADAHLGVDSPEKEATKLEKLLLFLEKTEKEASHLFILGDLFDFWFEYRNVVPKDYYSVIAKLHEMTRGGVKVLYICGNHDWWHRDFFQRSVGIVVHREAIQTVLNGKKLFLAHGDGLGETNLGDRLFNRILRSNINVRLFSLLHPDLGMRLGRWVSKLSRRNNSKMSDETLLGFAKEKLSQGFDYVILAHTHSPFLYREGEKLYLNVGDWMESFTYAEMNSEGIELRQFEV